MSFIAWFYRQLKKLDQSLDEFYESGIRVNVDGTVTYDPILTHENIPLDTTEGEQDVPK